MNYTIADIAVRFNVGYRGFNKWIVLSNTKIALSLVTILYKQGLINSFELRENNIMVMLKYNKTKPLWKKIKVVSTPGHRVYWTNQQLSMRYNYKSLADIYIISTPVGLLTSTECLLGNNSGGEILFKISL